MVECKFLFIIFIHSVGDLQRETELCVNAVTLGPALDGLERRTQTALETLKQTQVVHYKIHVYDWGRHRGG